MRVSQAYATAAYRHAQQQKNTASWVKLIGAIGDIKHAGLKNPNVSKAELIQLLTKHLKPDAVQQHWLSLIVQHQHMHLIPSIAAHFIKLENEQNNIHDILIRTAHPLSKSLTQKILKTLQTKKDLTYHAQFIVDPSIIGGVQIEYRGKQFDYSIAKTLNQLIVN